MKKIGSGSRATFVSPYLRRPLRPLHKVLNERDDQADDGLLQEAANDVASDYGTATWSLRGKSAVVTD